MSENTKNENNSSGGGKVVMDVFSFCLSIGSSVFIVFVNKILMGASGYAFAFATTLCALHFMSCWIYIYAAQSMGWVKKISIPFIEALLFCLLADVSVASLNMSLMINSVGFYQVAKLLNIPFIAIVEFIFYKKKFSVAMLFAMMVTICGVAVVTVSDVQVNWVGVVIAGISIFASSMQQLEVGRMQRKHEVQANELLSNTAPLQGITLLLIGPFVDKMVTQRWVVEYDFNVPALLCIAATCIIAVVVNISQFMVLGRFSASTYQVIGHSKTILVLTGSWILLGESITMRQLCGMVLAVCGMIAYGIAASNFKHNHSQQKNNQHENIQRILQIEQKYQNGDNNSNGNQNKDGSSLLQQQQQ